MGIVSKVVSTVRKIDGIYTMLEGAVKKIDEVYVFVEGKRRLVFPESALIFEKTTPGAYEFTVPEKYDYVAIEYAGAGGGGIVGSGSVPDRLGGGGSIKKINKSKISNKTIYGIVGGKGGVGGTTVGTTPAQGGTGYSTGENGTVGEASLGLRQIAGAGGGSTSVSFNNAVYEASAGGGAFTQHAGSYGGKGGGAYGGARKTSVGDGNNATDPNQISLNSGDGYVKIYGIAG